MPRRVLTQFERDMQQWSDRATMSLQIWHAQIGVTVKQLRIDARRSRAGADSLRISANNLMYLRKRIKAVIDSRGGAEHPPQPRSKL